MVVDENETITIPRYVYKTMLGSHGRIQAIIGLLKVKDESAKDDSEIVTTLRKIMEGAE